MGQNTDYLLECQHIRTNRDDINFNQDMCVLWIFKARDLKGTTQQEKRILQNLPTKVVQMD